MAARGTVSHLCDSRKSRATWNKTAYIPGTVRNGIAAANHVRTPMMNNSVADRGGRCKPCFMAFQRNCERTGQGRTTAADGRAFKNGGDGARAQVSHKFLMFADVINASRALYHPRSKTSDGSESPPSPLGLESKGAGTKLLWRSWAIQKRA